MISLYTNPLHQPRIDLARKPVASVKEYVSPSLHDQYCEAVVFHLSKGLTMDQALDLVLESPESA